MDRLVEFAYRLPSIVKSLVIKLLNMLLFSHKFIATTRPQAAANVFQRYKKWKSDRFELALHSSVRAICFELRSLERHTLFM